MRSPLSWASEGHDPRSLKNLTGGTPGEEWGVLLLCFHDSPLPSSVPMAAAGTLLGQTAPVTHVDPVDPQGCQCSQAL